MEGRWEKARVICNMQVWAVGMGEDKRKFLLLFSQERDWEGVGNRVSFVKPKPKEPSYCAATRQRYSPQPSRADTDSQTSMGREGERERVLHLAAQKWQ